MASPSQSLGTNYLIHLILYVRFGVFLTDAIPASCLLLLSSHCTVNPRDSEHLKGEPAQSGFWAMLAWVVWTRSLCC